MSMAVLQAIEHAAYALPGRVAAPSPAPSGGAGNPLDGVTPDLGVLGGAFGETWVRVAGAVWALMIAASALYLGGAFLSLAQNRQAGNSYGMSDSMRDVKLRAMALGGLVGLPVIVGAIIAVVG
jgi:hypothetical protein